MRYVGAEKFDGMVLWGGGTGGPTAVPGDYSVKFTISKSKTDDETDESEPELKPTESTELATASGSFTILKDPRSSATKEDLMAQFEFLSEVRDKLSETHKSIGRLRDVRQQIESFSKRLNDNEDYKDVVSKGKDIAKQLSEIEKTLYQTQNQAPQDPLNFPIRLNNRLSALIGVVSGGDNRPTKQAYAVRDELTGLIDAEIAKMNEAIDSGVSDFNDAVSKAKIPAIFVESE